MLLLQPLLDETIEVLLAENGGHLQLTTDWAMSLLHRMKFVKRRESSKAKVTVDSFLELKEQFVLDIKAVVEIEDVPVELIFNWGHTSISIIPRPSWTMELKGSKRVEIVGISDKGNSCCVLCNTGR